MNEQMIKLIKISTFLLVLFLLCAPSCENDEERAHREEEIISGAKKEIRSEFETEYLTEASLFAHEVAAKQKLSDFTYYVDILTDTTLDKSFREKAGEMIRSSFLSEQITIDLYNEPEGQILELNVHQLVRLGLDNQLILPAFSYDSIFVHEPLHRISNFTYSGILKFKQNFTEKTTGLLINPISRTADVYVQKEVKIFGTDTLKVWNVRLGEIRQK
jgi:hypothetical protein